jgi:hypothetical protein
LPSVNQTRSLAAISLKGDSTQNKYKDKVHTLTNIMLIYYFYMLTMVEKAVSVNVIKAHTEEYLCFNFKIHNISNITPFHES